MGVDNSSLTELESRHKMMILFLLILLFSFSCCQRLSPPWNPPLDPPEDLAPCYGDNPNRILPDAFIETNPMTINMCKEHCFVKNNYIYAGVQFYNQCFCGNDKPDGSLIRDPEECNAPCAGDNTEICGGTWRMNIYQGITTSTTTTTTTTVTSTTNLSACNN